MKKSKRSKLRTFFPYQFYLCNVQSYVDFFIKNLLISPILYKESTLIKHKGKLLIRTYKIDIYKILAQSKKFRKVDAIT